MTAVYERERLSTAIVRVSILSALHEQTELGPDKQVCDTTVYTVDDTLADNGEKLRIRSRKYVVDLAVHDQLSSDEIRQRWGTSAMFAGIAVERVGR